MSVVLKDLKDQAKAKELTIEDLLLALGTKGHSVLIAVFTIPFLQPIPTLGLSAPFGLCIALIGLNLAFGLDPWLPLKLRNIKLGSSASLKSIQAIEEIFKRLERFVKPRWSAVANAKLFVCITGLLICINGILMALPLPIPGTNSAPAWSLLVLALGKVEEDGCVISLGYFLSFLCFCFFALLVFLPMYGITLLNV